VWSLSADVPDDTFKAFATRVSPFPSLHDAARVVDAMPPRALGALLCVELGWLERDGALRRQPDCQPFEGTCEASVSASARRFWALCRQADPAAPAARWSSHAPPGWALLVETGGTAAAVEPDCGSLPLLWSSTTLSALTKRCEYRARLVTALDVGPRRSRASTLDAAPAVLDARAVASFADRALLSEMTPGALQMAIRGNNTAALLLLRLRASGQLWDVCVFPPPQRVALALTHLFADHDAAHADPEEGAAPPGEHVRGLSTNGSAVASVKGWLASLDVRGRPVPEATYTLVMAYAGRTMSHLFPCDVFRRPPNLPWHCVEAAEQVCPGSTDW
jgi:hypothetical protein